MTRKNVQQYKRLRRVAEFGANHVSVFPITSIVGEILAAIVSAVAKLSEYAQEQVAANAAIRRGSNKRKEARQALLTMMGLMDQTARVLNIDDFWMPKRPTEAALIDSGYHFAKAAEPLKTEFIRYGMPPDFIETLTTIVQDLEAGITVRNAGKDANKQAIERYETVLGEALILLDRFEALVANSMSGNPGIVAGWEAARRVERLPQQSKAEPEKQETPPAATTTPGGEAASATAV